MSYEEDIADLFDKHVTNRPRGDVLDPLLAALGCAHVTDNLDERGPVFVPSKPMPPEYEPLIAATLIKIVHAHIRRDGDFSSDEDLALLGALVQNERWHACLQTMVAATDFAILLSFYWISDPTTGGLDLMNEISPAVFDLVNTWLKPAKPFKHYDTERAASYDIAVCLFGETWCTLALSDLEKSPQNIPDRLLTLRPEILECLLPERVHTVAAVLPDLEGPAYA